MEGNDEIKAGNDETYVQGKNVKYVLFGIIVVLLIINLVQFRQLLIAQDAIDVLGMRVVELQEK